MKPDRYWAALDIDVTPVVTGGHSYQVTALSMGGRLLASGWVPGSRADARAAAVEAVAPRQPRR